MISDLQFGEAKAKMLANKGGESVFTLFLQLDEPLESFGKIANGHFFYTPSRKGLGNTHRKELYDLLANFENTSKQQTLDWLDKFLNLHTLRFQFPALRIKIWHLPVKRV